MFHFLSSIFFPSKVVCRIFPKPTDSILFAGGNNLSTFIGMIITNLMISYHLIYERVGLIGNALGLNHSLWVFFTSFASFSFVLDLAFTIVRRRHGYNLIFFGIMMWSMNHWKNRTNFYDEYHSTINLQVVPSSTLCPLPSFVVGRAQLDQCKVLATNRHFWHVPDDICTKSRHFPTNISWTSGCK